MATNENTESTFSHKVMDDIDEVFDEKSNTILALRRVQWGNSEPKLDMRKWYVDINKETAGKGFTFLTPQGPHNLVKALIKHNFGDTKEILKGIKDREDFRPALISVLGKDNGIINVDECEHPIEEEYYDPKQFLLEG